VVMRLMLSVIIVMKKVFVSSSTTPVQQPTATSPLLAASTLKYK
jgi:hypothetical protein